MPHSENNPSVGVAPYYVYRVAEPGKTPQSQGNLSAESASLWGRPFREVALYPVHTAAEPGKTTQSQGEGVGVYQVWGRNVSQEAWSHWDSGGRWMSAQWWSAPPSLEWLCSASGRSPGHCLSGTLAPCRTWNTHKQSCAYSLVWILLWVLPIKIQITAFLKYAKPEASTRFCLPRAFSAVSKSSDHYCLSATPTHTDCP